MSNNKCKPHKWKKLMLDDMFGVKEENQKCIDAVFKFLDMIMCLFNDMKRACILFESTLTQFKSCDNPDESTTTMYNSALAQFINTLEMYLQFVIANDCGVGAKMIKNSMVINGYSTLCSYTHEISLKLPNCNWVHCSRFCIVDNMSVDPENTRDPCDLINAIICVYIGSNIED